MGGLGGARALPSPVPKETDAGLDVAKRMVPRHRLFPLGGTVGARAPLAHAFPHDLNPSNICSYGRVTVVLEDT